MSDLIKKIANKNYDESKSLFEEKMVDIVEKKMLENKKIIGAKLEQLTMTRKAFDGGKGARAEKLYRDVIEEKYGKGYVSPDKKIEDAMKKRGIDPNSSDKYRKEMERLNTEYEKLKAKDKKIDEEEQPTSWANPLNWVQKIKKANQDALDKAGITPQTYTDLGNTVKTIGTGVKDVAKNLVTGKPYDAVADAFTTGSKTVKNVVGDKTASDVFDKLPTNVGTLAKHASGIGGGIKNPDKVFDIDQQKKIADVAANAHKRSGGKLGKNKEYFQTNYDDYKSNAPGNVGYGQSNDLSTMAKNSMNKGFQIKGTLGSFGIKPNKQGGLDVTDIYNFDNKTAKAGLTKDIDAGKASAYATIRNRIGEKGDQQYPAGDERTKTNFTIPKEIVAKDPYWRKNHPFMGEPSTHRSPTGPVKTAATPAKTSTPSTPAYKAPAQPKAMTPAKTPLTQRSATGQRFDAEYKAAKQRGDKQFTFDGRPIAVKEETELHEARIAIVKARIRGGKVQRRKKVSNVPGYTLRAGGLKRMSAVERRNRRMGQKRGKIKRKMKLARTLIKRQRSLRKRQSLGLK